MYTSRSLQMARVRKVSARAQRQSRRRRVSWVSRLFASCLFVLSRAAVAPGHEGSTASCVCKRRVRSRNFTASSARVYTLYSNIGSGRREGRSFFERVSLVYNGEFLFARAVGRRSMSSGFVG